MLLITEVTATGLVTVSYQLWQPSLKLVHGIGRTEKLKHSISVTVLVKLKVFFFLGGGGGKFYQVSIIIMIVTMLLSNTWTCVW